MKKWLGSTLCDICDTDCTKGEYFFDSPTKDGPWALQCEVCHSRHGISFGQKYDGKTKEKICDLHKLK